MTRSGRIAGIAETRAVRPEAIPADAAVEVM